MPGGVPRRLDECGVRVQFQRWMTIRCGSVNKCEVDRATDKLTIKWTTQL